MSRIPPLYPHVPKSRNTVVRLPQDELRFLPDSPEFIAQSIKGIGYRDKLASVFREAIARVNRR